MIGQVDMLQYTLPTLHSSAVASNARTSHTYLFSGFLHFKGTAEMLTFCSILFVEFYVK